MSDWLGDLKGRMLAKSPWRQQAAAISYRAGVLRSQVESFVRLTWHAMDGRDVEQEMRSAYRAHIGELGRLGKLAMGALSAYREEGTLRQFGEAGSVDLPASLPEETPFDLIPVASPAHWLHELPAANDKSPRPHGPGAV